MSEEQVTQEVTPEAQPEAQPESKVQPEGQDTLLGKKIVEETPEQKTAREATEAATKVAAVPDKYEIKAPEGQTIDSKAIETMTPMFKELGLSQVQVQKLIDTYAPIVKAQSEANHNQAMKDYDALTNGWKDEAVKELGADYSKKLAPASALLDKYPQGAKVRELLEESRIGNHPEMVKFMIWLGASIKSDSFPDQNKTTIQNNFDDKIAFKVK